MSALAAPMLPWLDPVFDSWSIVGMNHYHINGERCLFVAMTRSGFCIKVEGRDDGWIWTALRAQAAAVSEPTP
jgi:hypothetical protein